MSTESAAQVCERLRRLDAQYGTWARSPLHHDNRCPLHGPPDRRRP